MHKEANMGKSRNNGGNDIHLSLLLRHLFSGVFQMKTTERLSYALHLERGEEFYHIFWSAYRTKTKLAKQFPQNASSIFLVSP